MPLAIESVAYFISDCVVFDLQLLLLCMLNAILWPVVDPCLRVSPRKAIVSCLAYSKTCSIRTALSNVKSVSARIVCCRTYTRNPHRHWSLNATDNLSPNSQCLVRQRNSDKNTNSLTFFLLSLVIMESLGFNNLLWLIMISQLLNDVSKLQILQLARSYQGPQRTVG